MNHHVVEHDITAFQRVFGVGNRVVVGGGLEHTHEHRRLFHGQSVGRGIEIGLAGRLDTIGVTTEIHCVSIHRENLVLVVDGLQLDSDNPFLGLHDEHLQTGNLAEQTGGILCAHAEHVLGQLLRNGGGTAGALAHDGVFGRTEHTDGVHTDVLVETLVLGVYQHFPEHGVHLAELHRRAVFREIFADEFAVGRIQFRSLSGLRFADAGEVARRLTEKPQEVDIYRTEIDDEK